VELGLGKVLVVKLIALLLPNTKKKLLKPAATTFSKVFPFLLMKSIG